MPRYYFHLGSEADELDEREEAPVLHVLPETAPLITTLDDEFVPVLQQCLEPVIA